MRGTSGGGFLTCSSFPASATTSPPFVAALLSDSLEGLLSLVRRSQFIFPRIARKSLGTMLDNVKPLCKLWCLPGLTRSRGSLLTPGLGLLPSRKALLPPSRPLYVGHSPQVSCRRPLTEPDPVLCTGRNEINFVLRAPNSSGQRQYLFCGGRKEDRVLCLMHRP